MSYTHNPKKPDEGRRQGLIMCVREGENEWVLQKLLNK